MILAALFVMNSDTVLCVISASTDTEHNQYCIRVLRRILVSGVQPMNFMLILKCKEDLYWCLYNFTSLLGSNFMLVTLYCLSHVQMAYVMWSSWEQALICPMKGPLSAIFTLEHRAVCTPKIKVDCFEVIHLLKICKKMEDSVIIDYDLILHQMILKIALFRTFWTLVHVVRMSYHSHYLKTWSLVLLMASVLSRGQQPARTSLQQHQ